MHIGALAKLTGASPKAIRLYEELGLLTNVQRRGAYRFYSDRNTEQVRLIRQAQALGFRLSELKDVLRPAAGEPDWHVLRDHLVRKQLSVEREIQRLTGLSAQLARMADEVGHCLAASSAGAPAACAVPA